ncbi:MAG: hypothetical protein ACI3V3_05960 [Faecousia sp.]
MPMIEPISLNFHSQNSGVSGGQFRFDDAAPEMNRVSPLLAPDINVARVPQCQEAFRLLKAHAYQKKRRKRLLAPKNARKPNFQRASAKGARLPHSEQMEFTIAIMKTHSSPKSGIMLAHRAVFVKETFSPLHLLPYASQNL